MNTELSTRIWLLFFLTAISCGFWPNNASAATPQVFTGSHAYSSFLVDGAGVLNAWGENGHANLGIGGTADQLDPVAVPFPAGVHGWRAVATAYANGAWTYALGDDGQLYAAGFVGFGIPANYYFALVAPPAGAGGWVTVSASAKGWLAVSTNGSIYGSVNGTVLWPPRPGALRWTQVVLCSLGGSLSQPDLFALDNRGKVFGVYSATAWFQSPPFTEIPVPTGATAWTNLAAGNNFVLAQANNGNLYGWGHNESGQLGVGVSFTYTNTPQLIPLPSGKNGWRSISAGGLHALATTTDGQLFVWGNPSYGQLGLGDTSPTRKSPTPVPNLTNVTAIAAGYYHSLAVVDCQILTWGKNPNGELGLGFTSPYYPLPISPQFSYDVCSTNPFALPVVSITAADPNASEGTWLSTLGQPATNTGRFEISRVETTASILEVHLAITGTASNGVDYFSLPVTVSIPANSNSASLLLVPTGSTLALDPSTVVVNLLPDAAYLLGNTTNATVTLIQYQSQPDGPPPTTFKLQLFVGTNLNDQVFVIRASTNLIDWAEIGTGTNIFGVVTVNETNRTNFRQRFFQALPLINQ